jgi:hypothetical protein
LADHSEIEQQGIDLRFGETADLRQRVFSTVNWTEHQSMIESDHKRAMVHAPPNPK